MVYTTQYEHPSTNWNKVLSATKRCFVHRIFDMASTLIVLAVERSRAGATTMICLSQNPFEFDTKRACNILKRLNVVRRCVALGRGCFVVAPKLSYPSSPPEFFSTGERREERHCVAFFRGARHFAKTHLSHSIKVYFCNHHTMVGPKYVRRTTRECPTRVLKGCVRY